MDTNKKSFDLIVRTKETFDLYIHNFQMAVTFFFRIRDTIRLTIVSKLSTKLFSNISIKKIRIISTTKLIESLSPILNIKKVSFLYTIKERLQAFSTIYSGVTIEFSMRMRQKLATTLNQGILSMSLNPLLAKLFLLLDFDLDTLFDVDSLTLGDMDYILA